MTTTRVAAAGPSGAAAVEVINPSGQGRFVLVCEHASNAIPEEYADLGLDGAALESHIAWDPGALEVAISMSASFDAPLVAQNISRLVYDCNRPPMADDAIPARSEIYDVPGNVGLTLEQRADRIARFYSPFREALAACIDRQMTIVPAPVILSIHSFTPIYDGVRRDLHLGILHDRDARYADALLAAAAVAGDLVVRRNEPYGPGDGVTHTLEEHALSRGLLNAMIEIRNDLVSDEAGQAAMAKRLTDWSPAALNTVAGAAESANAMVGDGHA